MSKFLVLLGTFIGASVLAMGISLASDSCDATAKGFLPCAEGKAAEQTQATEAQSLLHQAGGYQHRRHPHPGRHYPRPMPPPFPGYYPPPPAPFCYTRSGFCHMVVATPPGVYCTCNFGYYFDKGITGY